MTLRNPRTKKKPRISAPERPVHISHISHDEITQKLQGLPPDWIKILRDSGAISEDLVLPKKSKGNGVVYGNGMFNSSKSSLQKLWRSVSSRNRHKGPDDKTNILNAKETFTIAGSGESRRSSTFAIAGSGESRRSSMFTIAGSGEFPRWRSTSSIQSVFPDDSASNTGSPARSLVTSENETPVSFSKTLSPARSLATAESDNTIEQIQLSCGLTFHHKDYEEINSDLQVVDSLGHGSLGVVEEVRISPLFQSFVRKRVQIPFYRRKQYLSIINQEARVLQDLSHCHIVKMIGSYSEIPSSGRQFYSLLMAPVGERDLKTLLDIFGDKSSSQPADWIEERKTWLNNWFRCLSSALAYIHSQGVRHQDIKPSNIIHRGSAIYFTDFSSASQFQIGQTTSTENPARTSAMYAAPEVVDNDEGLGRHGRGTDVFALGAVFTEMLAVLCGYSIDEYHQYLLNPDRGNISGVDTSTVRKSLLYGRKLEEVGRLFSDDCLYEDCISKMLQADREQRPDAEEVAVQIRKHTPWILQSCTCESQSS
jgi:hypothetical protein